MDKFMDKFMAQVKVRGRFIFMGRVMVTVMDMVMVMGKAKDMVIVMEG